MRKMEPRPIFSIANPNKAFVVRELDRLKKEWADWLEMSRNLGDSTDYDPETCSEAIKDGFANRRKHEILREKTLVFIGNNFSGYEFLFENWPNHPHEDNTSRLRSISLVGFIGWKPSVPLSNMPGSRTDFGWRKERS
jgi:hypothetical protein